VIGRIRILAGDWDRLQRVHQGREPLASELLDRGRQLAAEVPVERLPADAPLPERLDWLTRSVPRRAASIATLGYELVMNRGRLERSTELEKTTYERDLELQKDIVPPLKEQARALREQIRRLERELTSRGGDPSAGSPAIPAANAITADSKKNCGVDLSSVTGLLPSGN